MVEPFAQVLVVTHDNPDPDAISVGWGLLTLIEERLGKRARLIGGGGTRSTNRPGPLHIVGAGREAPRDTPLENVFAMRDCARYARP